MRHLEDRLFEGGYPLVVALLVLPPAHRLWRSPGSVRVSTNAVVPVRLGQTVHDLDDKGAEASPRLAVRDPVLEVDVAGPGELLGSLRGDEDHRPAATEVLYGRDQPLEHLHADPAREVRVEGGPPLAVSFEGALASRRVQVHKLRPRRREAGRQPLRVEDVHRGVREGAVLQLADDLGALAHLQATRTGYVHDRQRRQRRGGHPAALAIPEPAGPGV